MGWLVDYIQAGIFVFCMVGTVACVAAAHVALSRDYDE